MEVGEQIGDDTVYREMTIITPKELASWLKDATFVDYFSVFLSQPVFGQRLVYKQEEKNFEYDPPIKRSKYRVEKYKMVQWLIEERVPYFLNSVLYREYKLCKKLTQVHWNTENPEMQNKFEKLQARLGHTMGMHLFVQHLHGTSGQILVDYWMDAQTWLDIVPEDVGERWRQVRLLQVKYFKKAGLVEEKESTSLLRDASMLLSGIPIDGSSEDLRRLQDCRLPLSRTVVDRITHVQDAAVQLLQDYWVPHFLEHKDRRKENNQLVPAVEMCEARKRRAQLSWKALFPLEKEEIIREEDVPREINMKQTKRSIIGPTVPAAQRVSSKKPLDPKDPNIMDQILDLYVSGSSSSSSCSSDEDVTSCRVKTLPYLDVTKGKSLVLDAPSSRILTPVKSMAVPSPAFPTRHSPLPQIKTSKGKKKKQKKKKSKKKKKIIKKEEPKTTKPAKVPVLKAKCPKLPAIVEAPQEVHEAIPRPRTSKPVISTLPSELRLPSYNAKLRHENRDLIAAVASDSMAGNPLKASLVKDKKANLHYIFWHEAQQYLSVLQHYAPFPLDANGLRFRLARTLVVRFLQPDGRGLVPWCGERLALRGESVHMLQHLLVVLRGDEALREAQDEAAMILRSNWQEFHRNDYKTFTRSCIVGRVRRTSQRSGLLATSGLLASNKSGELVTRAESSCQAGYTAGTDLDFTTQDVSVDEGRGVIPSDMERRKWKAFRLGLRAARIEDGSLPGDDLVAHEMYYNTDYGSLALSMLKIIPRRDLAEAAERRRLNAQWRRQQESLLFHTAANVPRIFIPEDETPYYMKSFKKGGVWHHRPLKAPRTFQDILRDDISVEFFRRFMTCQCGDDPVLFHMAIEELKSCRDYRTRQTRQAHIVRKFFPSADKAMELLQCDAEILQVIPTQDKVTQAMLISAHSCVMRELQDRWFAKYVATFTDMHGVTSQGSFTNTRRGQDWGKGKAMTKAFWKSFIRQVMIFRRGILDPELIKQFEGFLKLEMRKEIVKQQKSTGQTYVFGMPVKKLIRNKLVDVTKLVNDLYFLAECDRYRSMCDNATNSAESGVYCFEDERMLENKAKTIVMCYVDSELPPRIQINASIDMAENIVRSYNDGMIERGLFHDVNVTIFPVMAHLWKRFQSWRFASMFIKLHTPDELLAAEPKIPEYNPVQQNDIQYKCIRQKTDDDQIRMQFSLSNGVRMLIPTRAEPEASDGGAPKEEEEEEGKASGAGEGAEESASHKTIPAVDSSAGRRSRASMGAPPGLGIQAIAKGRRQSSVVQAETDVQQALRNLARRSKRGSSITPDAIKLLQQRSSLGLDDQGSSSSIKSRQESDERMATPSGIPERRRRSSLAPMHLASFGRRGTKRQSLDRSITNLPSIEKSTDRINE